MENKEVPVFNVVALGPPRAGKTVYLATLHHVIGGNAIADGISFTTDEDKRAWLQGTYRQVVSPDRDWPPRTSVGQSIREVVFQCAVEWTKGPSMLHREPRHYPFRVFDISYIDYAGDWVVDTDQYDGELIASFKERLAGAHVIIGIIDGMRMLQYLRNDEGGRDFPENDLRPIVEMMKRYQVPVHFVITKSDLLRDYTITDIEKALQASPGTGFSELYRMRSDSTNSSRGRRVRIIPVSSVGRDFVSLQGDGTFSKLPTGRARQENVEIPLVAAVIDFCDMAQEILSDQAKSDRAAKRHGKESPARKRDPMVVLSPIGPIVNLDATVAFAVTSGVKAGHGLDRIFGAVFGSMSQQYGKIRAHSLQGVTSGEAALVYVAHSFRRRLREYENQIKVPQ
jgi:hypothetical protein